MRRQVQQSRSALGQNKKLHFLHLQLFSYFFQDLMLPFEFATYNASTKCVRVEVFALEFMVMDVAHAIFFDDKSIFT